MLCWSQKRELYLGFIGLRELIAGVACAMHGTIIGGGLAAALSCDYIVAATATTVQHGNLSRGLCPLGLLSQTFLSAVGRARSLEVYLQDTRLSCSTAVEMGLVDEVCDSIDETQGRARQIAWHAARHEAVSAALRHSRERPDFQRQALEAFGHAMCQRQNSGLLASSLHDHLSAQVPALVLIGRGRRGSKQRKSVPLHGAPLNGRSVQLSPSAMMSSAALLSLSTKVSVKHVWLDERITGGETPVEGNTVCIYRGRGANFCLGGNANASKIADGSFLNQLPAYEKLCRQLMEHEMPIIAVCHGATRGGGMLFASTASALLAHMEATFGFPEIHRGVLPGLVSVAAQRRLDLAACERLMCMRDAIRAPEAIRIAFADYVGATSELESETQRVSLRLCELEAPLLRSYFRVFESGSSTAAAEMARGVVDANLGRLHEADESETRTFPFGIDEASGVAKVDLQVDAAASLRFFCQAAAESAPLRAKLRVIVITVGDDKSADNADVPDAMDTAHLNPSAREHSRFEDAMRRIYEFHVPIVCVAKGQASGLPLAAMLCADYRIADEGATFAFDHTNIWRLRTLLRPQDEQALRAGHGAVDARRARLLGLISELCLRDGPHPKRAEQRGKGFASWLTNHPALAQQFVLTLSRASPFRCPLADGAPAVRSADGLPSWQLGGATALDVLPGIAKLSLLQMETRTDETRTVLHRLLAVATSCRVADAPSEQYGALRDAISRRRVASFRQLRTLVQWAPHWAQAREASSLLNAPSRRRGHVAHHARTPSTVGIHRLEVYVPRHCTTAELLSYASGIPQRYTTGHMMEQYGGCGIDEDASSMLLTVISRLIRSHAAARMHVGMLLVGGCESLDRSKSVKSELMQVRPSPCLFCPNRPNHSLRILGRPSYPPHPSLHARCCPPSLSALRVARPVRRGGRRRAEFKPRRRQLPSRLPRLGSQCRLGWPLGRRRLRAVFRAADT